jgi:hypothetical protein
VSERAAQRTRVSRANAALGLAILLAAADPPGTQAAQVSTWRPVASGVEYATVPVEKPIGIGDGILHVVRIDPARAELRAHLASEPGERRRTAREWCEAKNLVVATNLGMYATDLRSNVGYARKGAHLNNGRFHPQYKSFLAFGPRRPQLDAAVLLDAEEPRLHDRLAAYEVVIQNLRLVRAPGQNAWSKQEKRWTEAAIAVDRQGRILFLFTRTPFSMWELNRALLSLPLGIRKAMHVEGGPEASLSVRGPAFELHLDGSYETAFHEGDDLLGQLAIPNVIGVAAAPED